MPIKVKVFPKSKHESVERIASGQYKVCLRESAEGNRANRRLIEVMAMEYNVSVGAVRIVSGHRKPNKVLKIID